MPGATTANGTFPVYARYTVTTMTGTNPDGSHYVDPGIPWVSYFNGGDALHGFVRGSYGFPQSDGCVEMPVANAAMVFPLTRSGPWSPSRPRRGRPRRGLCRALISLRCLRYDGSSTSSGGS